MMWRAYLEQVAHERPAGEGAVRVRATDDGGRRVEDTATQHALRFTAGEWWAFRRGVLAGEFDPGAPSRWGAAPPGPACRLPGPGNPVVWTTAS